jgi:hypothetical protein
MERSQAPENPKANEFWRFSSVVVPQLVRLVTDFSLKEKFDCRDLADASTFAYREAIVKFHTPIGEWSEEIAEETILHLYLDCFLRAEGLFPEKNSSYISEMNEFVKILYNGALDRLATYAALKPRFYEVRYNDFVQRRYQSISDVIRVEELFNLEILKEVDHIRDKFR